MLLTIRSQLIQTFSFECTVIKGALFAKIVNFCYPQKLSDMIDALIKRVSVT
jgi:hypothetical protein